MSNPFTRMFTFGSGLVIGMLFVSAVQLYTNPPPSPHKQICMPKTYKQTAVITLDKMGFTCVIHEKAFSEVR